MKKALLILLTISFSAAFSGVSAQGCGNILNYIPGPNTAVGFQNSDSIPCAVQGVAYNDTIPFKMYNTFDYLGHHGIDSITLDTIFNLPCGLCWSLNKASKTYVANETGSINIVGTTTDMVGQYNLRLGITAYLTSGDPLHPATVGPNTVDAAGIKIWLRVKAANGSCTAVDTSSQATDQATASGCTTAINEVAANVASINIMPNPMNSNATLTFTVERSANYTVKITDITGQVISTKQIQANAGVNTSTIERGKLSSGIYFLSLTDGVSLVTRKFIIAD